MNEPTFFKDNKILAFKPLTMEDAKNIQFVENFTSLCKETY